MARQKCLFANSDYDTVIAISISHNYAMMHLDTVFTMINYDQFTVHPDILTEDGKSEIDLIPTGNGDPIVAPCEQWNDGSNTLAIAPGEVATYNRNCVLNALLREHGILVHEVRSSELSRGRGGPCCMSCPIVREDI